nr:hypothetical protein [Candidatus Sigynarchaeota archaeon]
MLPVSTCHVVGLSFIFTVFFSGCIMLTYLLQKYRNVKHTVVMKYLILTFTFLVLAIAIDPVVFLFSRFLQTIDDANELIQAFTYVSFSSTAIANVFFTMFLKLVFYEQQGKIPWVKLVIGLELVVAVVAPVVAWMRVEDLVLILLFIHVTTSLSLYAFQSRKAFYLRRRMKGAGSGDRASMGAMGCIGIAGLL